jgi:hypothetical protein
VRTLDAAQPSVLYPASDEIADFGSPRPGVTFRVAQISATVGAGHAATATITL